MKSTYKAHPELQIGPIWPGWSQDHFCIFNYARYNFKNSLFDDLGIAGGGRKGLGFRVFSAENVFFLRMFYSIQYVKKGMRKLFSVLPELGEAYIWWENAKYLKIIETTA